MMRLYRHHHPREATMLTIPQALHRLKGNCADAVPETLLRQLGAELDYPFRRRTHRLALIDGSSFSMPDTPELQEAFGQPGGQAEGCGFPTAHLLVLFDAPTGFLRHALPAPLRTHDLAHAAAMHRALGPGDLL